jgi:hypothetical protein
MDAEYQDSCYQISTVLVKENLEVIEGQEDSTGTVVARTENQAPHDHARSRSEQNTSLAILTINDDILAWSRAADEHIAGSRRVEWFGSIAD